MEHIEQGLCDLLFETAGELGKFRRDSYKSYFLSLYEEESEFFKDIEKEYQESDQKTQFIDEIATAFVDRVGNKYDELQKKSAKEQFVLDHNTAMVVFVLPCVLYLRGDSSVPLSDALVEKWNGRFTKYHINSGTFEDINGGFKTKLCYITTAVCDSLGKPDDCYELEMLRTYRDDYLAGQADGKELIDQYYDIAPTIVNRINRQSNASDIYEGIYREYLCPCISKIEQHENEQCKEIYASMMKDLQTKYMGCIS